MRICKSVLGAVLALSCLSGSAGLAQDKTDKKDTAKGKAKSYVFHGKVEAVTAKGLTVNGEKAEGWMDAMTMSYPVDKPDILKQVKAGDRIMATVYQGDMTLHNVEVMPPDKNAKQKSK